MSKPAIILGIESSCDDTGAAVLVDGKIYSNIVASQKIHKQYGGVVPELASRAHMQNIIPVVDQALKMSQIKPNQLSAVAFTRGPGLMGSLMVGTAFAKAYSMSLGIPLIEVNHMHGHILAHFIEEKDGTSNKPAFPFLCLTVSGGHTQIVLVKNYFDLEVLGETIDDAAGEAFDKAAKVLGLPYPGGPLIDKYAREGNKTGFKFVKPRTPDLSFSFSGLKTAFINFVHKETSLNTRFIEENLNDICASYQHTVIEILMDKLKKASIDTGVKRIAIAGGVSANSELRNILHDYRAILGWDVFIPKFEYCTDNAAMIAITGYYKFLEHQFTTQTIAPTARYSF